MWERPLKAVCAKIFDCCEIPNCNEGPELDPHTMGALPANWAVPRMQSARLRSMTLRKAKQSVNHESTARSLLCRHTQQIDKAAPGPHVYELYSRLNATDAAILAQLRTGKSRLNSHLGRFDAAPSVECDECGEPETVEHFLIRCRKWTAQRRLLARQAGELAANVAPLLGGWDDYRYRRGRLLCGPKEKWKPNHQLVAATITFVKATGRLCQSTHT